MDPRTIFWKTEFVLPCSGGQWTLSGYSRSAYRSGFYINGLNIMLDGGPQSFKNPDHIFITHTHGDHIAELPFTMLEYKSDDKKVSIYCPEEATISLRQYIMQLFNTSTLSDTSQTTDSFYNLNKISSTYNQFRLIVNKQPLLIETVGADHSIPTVVYGFSTIKDKLDPKYLGISGKELGQLKKQGTQITVEQIDKKFCYVLDTSIKIFETSAFLLEYPVIIVECTFIYDDEIEHANEKKHIHWKQLLPYVETNKNSLFILTHFSLRYKDSEIKTFFDDVKQTLNIQNIHPWLTDQIKPE
jgi:ribonuclease Z